MNIQLQHSKNIFQQLIDMGVKHSVVLYYLYLGTSNESVEPEYIIEKKYVLISPIQNLVFIHSFGFKKCKEDKRFCEIELNQNQILKFKKKFNKGFYKVVLRKKYGTVFER